MAEGVADAPAGRFYLDDLHVGQRFTSAAQELTADAIREFARRFDPQPFHLDEAAARESLFGGLVASGWHTAALSMRLQVDGGLPIAGGIVGVGGEIGWLGPARPGDVLHVESEVLEVRLSRSRPDRGLVTVRSDTLNQDGTVVQRWTATLVVPRRPGEP
jgi:acyl dehydratase